MDRLNVATSVESSLITVGWYNVVDTGTFTGAYVSAFLFHQ